MAKKPAGWTSKDLEFTDEMAGYIPKLAKLETIFYFFKKTNFLKKGQIK